MKPEPAGEQLDVYVTSIIRGFSKQMLLFMQPFGEETDFQHQVLANMHISNEEIDIDGLNDYLTS